MHKNITAIVPVYNGENFLARCIDSVLNQQKFDISSIELLLINDGSKDNSLIILNKYAKKHPETITVINQSNSGVAKTRNKGIEIAKGTYTIFIDQDDWIDTDYCVTLFTAIEKGQYDAVFSGMKRPDETGKIVNKDVYKTDTNEYFSRFLSLSVWAKIHRTGFLRESCVTLFDNSFGEDIAFVFEEVQKTDRIKCIEYCGYNWFYNTQSVSNTTQRTLNDTNTRAIVLLQNRLALIDRKKTKANTYFVTMITAYYLFLTGKGSTADEFRVGTKVLITNLKELYPSWDKNPHLFIAPKGTLPIFSLGVKVFMVLYKTKLLHPFAYIYCKGNRND